MSIENGNQLKKVEQIRLKFDQTAQLFEAAVIAVSQNEVVRGIKATRGSDSFGLVLSKDGVRRH